MSVINNEYKAYQEDDYQEYLEFKEKRDRAKGILPDGSILGDSVHPLTEKSYNKLDKPVPDSVRLATLRPNERMLRMLTEMGKKPEVKTTISRVYRLRDKDTGKEYMLWNKQLEFLDKNEGLRTLSYDYCGYHPEVRGEIKRGANYKIIGSEITEYRNIYDKVWSTKAFDELLKENNSDKIPSLGISYTKPKGKGTPISTLDRSFVINNIAS